MNTSDNITLILPALRAHMGDWIYYVTFLKMRDIADRIKVAEEIHTNSSLNEFIQRRLSDRSDDIKNYLKNQSQRFFNTLVVGVYGGSPSWYEMSIGGNQFLSTEDIPSHIDGAVGILVLNGEEKLFAIDGQHRVVGIRKALTDGVNIEEEEVSAVFVSHKNDCTGLERTRRLFTTLNRYAKPVSKYDAIALDEDDIIAVVTRQLLNEVSLFDGKKISTATSKSIPRNDVRSLTTIVSLYDTMDIFLKEGTNPSWKKFKQFRPPQQKINEYYQKAVSLWILMAENIPALRYVMQGSADSIDLSDYRHKDGGNLLFRPIGLELIVTVVRDLLNFGMSLEEAIKRISRIPMELNETPWKGLLWDEVNKRMLTQATNRNVGKKLLYHALGGNLALLKTTPEKLKQEWSGLLNRNISEVNLPNYM